MAFSRIHRRLTFGVGLVGILGAAFCGCGGGGGSSTPIITPPPGNFTAPGTTPFVNTNIGSRAACQANAHQVGRARWTVLVFINAANNLQPDSLINVAQMASVGSNADLNIIVQWKQTSTQNYFTSVAIGSTPSFVGTRRYRLTKHSQSDINRIAPPGIETNAALVGDTTVLDGDRLADPTTNTLTDNAVLTSDMGNYHTLANFVQWGAQAYPADHLAVVLWDHGSGALNVDNRSAKRLPFRSVSGVKSTTRGVSQDVQTGNQIATQEIPLGLANPPQPIDALVVDCSLQATTEVAYDVRNSARVFVGSEESPPGTGYPYDTWLTFLKTSAVASPCDAGQDLVNAMIAKYPTGTNITQSMTDLSKMDAVATALNAFGGSLKTYAGSAATLIKTARQGAQYFDFPEYKDLYGFADLIRTSAGVPAPLATAAANVETSLWGSNGAILVASHGNAKDFSGFSEALASGLSIFLPGPQTQSSVDNTTGFDPAWNQLGLAKAAPNWAAFLQAEIQ